ncbi:30S ribosomal protein S3 [Candidatus Gottesmanbacteria bacterium CG11_big_fil_rev_8_21_14_0_20_37_11]|uniref:Small ribosomal subunit protein uS3 n=3 Tax=Candidatus Gottesmaniibacteriota TaxID=1752720 RepID=A0A2M7RQP5_9BACT|nr:MAG: 30S ribosomal protein S3 [Candidatus Gottesmanbacteria bacterium CG1_02_37_22]PIP32617.1 MAG: 30S ribosomal protein S3 [Candidatus Gottesmanbacteria bacterium CG23_combo_of_CG06-09_8_20_14_all_37_19]PIR08493.1 MAG: 30S ribosomal protein S3 [Candidatus Gottesmanbacteria bacterium CG11_big_fil_rev_8_21_14_0_20_37_11]PIZ02633.1 MAG: 30S ribosomal protein S3 [Candidatus Gottesmanbacteria bacterium CG_4_10_14_0_8_um_filter_37_24]
MGHKVNPKGFRLGPLYTWDSRWFVGNKDYKVFVLEDVKIRQSLLKKLQPAGVTKIEIERSINKINIIINVVRPGMVIGRGGQGLEELKKFIQELIINHRKAEKIYDKKLNLKLDLKVEPVKNPNLSAYFIAIQIAEQLAKRMPHKRVVGYAVEKIMNAGAKGVKIMLAGRIAGAEISRRETFKRGSIPLSTIREDIDFVALPSLTKSGYIGVKVWICK